jgi:FHS family glucose/mannose:H+ symporter-like MFS transporter
MIGMAAISFPSLGNIFKDASEYALTSFQYGFLFVMQSGAAIAASLLSARLNRRIRLGVLLSVALAATCGAMAILSASNLIPTNHWTKYGALLAANLMAGTGIGLGISVLNVLAARAWPESSSTGVAVLHALIGAGLAIGPSVVSVAISLGEWWIAPVITGAALLMLAQTDFQEPAPVHSMAAEGRSSSLLKRDVFLFGLLAFLYGAIESTFSNWCVIYLHGEINLPVAEAGVALTVFWLGITAGRLGFVALPSERIRTLLATAAPLVIVGACVAVASAGGQWSGLWSFGLAGAGCACLYPAILAKAIANAGKRQQFVSGVMVSTVLLGAGLGTHLTGFWLEHFAVPLSHVFLWSAIVPLIMAALATVAFRRKYSIN